MTQTRTITQTRLAEMAGVSPATVSRALSDDPRISEEVTTRVKKLARDHNYRPSAAARSFVTQRNNTMGLVLFDRSLAQGIYAPLAEAVEEALSHAGIKLQIARWDSSQLKQGQLPPVFQDDGLDGVILAGLPPQWLIKKLTNWNMPTVLLGTTGGMRGINQISGDPAAGARLAAEHLIELGHRDIGLLIGPRKRELHKLYYDSFANVCVKAGLSKKALANATVECASPDVVEQVQMLFKKAPKTTAVFSDTDFVAWQAMQILRAMGRDVPDDVSIVGAGGWVSPGFVPVKLTTVNVQVEAMGRAAARMLIDHVQDDALPPQRVVIEPALRQGETSAEAPAASPRKQKVHA